jgi:hypothetical protein
MTGNKSSGMESLNMTGNKSDGMESLTKQVFGTRRLSDYVIRKSFWHNGGLRIFFIYVYIFAIM